MLQKTCSLVAAGAFVVLVAGLVSAADDAPAKPRPAGNAGRAAEPGQWQKLFADEDWYKGAEGKEQVFRGKLEAVPGAGGPSTLMRTSYYRLGDRTIYTGAKKVAALDKLVGKSVEIRGKPVAMELEGQSLSEIWPAAVRPAGGGEPTQGPGTKPEGPRPKPAPGDGAAARWNEAEIVFVGKLDGADAGPVAQSFPPIYTHRLHFTVEKVLRGDLKAGDKLTCHHSARQVQAPTFPVGESCVVAARRPQGRLQADVVEPADPKKVAEVQAACALPLGWKMVEGKPVSPWAGLGDRAWPKAAGLKADLVCSVTGRPALLSGGRVRLDVESVPPAKEIKWTNPDGDGEYKITVTNTTDQPIEVPALLSDGRTVLWQNSLVILCQGRAYVCPGFKPDVASAAPARLKPGESVSTVVNALRLDGPEWPRGGYRIQFQFCLGELSQTMSFYYMSRHHDAIRQGLAEK